MKEHRLRYYALCSLVNSASRSTILRYNNNNNIIIIIRLYLGVKSYLAGKRPTNWGHHLYHSKVDGVLSHYRHKYINTDMSPRAYGSTSLSEKTRKSNHLQMLEQRQHLLLDYFKTPSVGPAGNRTRASRTADWRLTN